jgi:hypothetical protein
VAGSPPQAPDEIGRLGPYQVLEVLGHGGMGVAFRAEDVRLQRLVALKAMLPALAQKLAEICKIAREMARGLAAAHERGLIHRDIKRNALPRLADEALAWSPDSQVVATGGTGIRLWNASTGDAEGDLRYVVQTPNGRETLTPAGFERKYGWKNYPDKVHLTNQE